jgi:SSS family solute:Na+ symporter
VLSQLNRVDASVLLVYLFVVFGIGLAVSRRKTSETDYFLAGRKLPWYAICISLFATNISTNNFLGFSGLGYSQGMAIAAFEWMTIFGLVALAFIFLPYYQKARVITLPEFLERRYDQRARILLSGTVLLLYVFMELASIFYTGALALGTVLGIDFMWALVFVALFVGAYTAYGGLAAVVWTDVFQGIILYAGGATVTLYGLSKVGGLRALMASEPQKFHTLLPANHELFPWPAILFGGLPLLAIWFWASSQVIVQRALAAKSDWDARMGTVCVAFLKIAAPFVFVVPGIVAFKLYPGLATPDAAYPTLIRNLVPVGVSGVVLAGLVAALMSSGDSVLNSCETLFTPDFYLRYINPEASQQKLVAVGRITTVGILIVTLCWAPILRNQQSIILYAINLMGFLAAPFVAIFLAGIFTAWATPTAAFVTVLASFPVSLALERTYQQLSHLYRIPIVFVFCVIVLALVSPFTKPKPKESLKGLLWRGKDVFRGDVGLLAPITDQPGADTIGGARLPLYKDYRLVAIVAIVLTAWMFYTFR